MALVQAMLKYILGFKNFFQKLAPGLDRIEVNWIKSDTTYSISMGIGKCMRTCQD